VPVDWGKIDAEREAAKSLVDLYDLAKKCQELHAAARMPVPEPLKRLLGVSEDNTNSGTKNSDPVNAPDHRRPPGATEEWLSIKVSEAGVSAVALAILRESGTIRPRDLNRAVLEKLPEATSGSVANMGTRLQGTIIDRTDEGWKLLNKEAAGIIIDDRIWGPSSAFQTQDIAAHRRESILHILSAYPSGLQIVQIVEQLRKCSWVHAPVNKDLLKADMEVLQKQEKVRRRGNSKKWEVVREEHS
jgi:hypothetical protein